MDLRLLQRFLELYPFQPATAVWRAVEVGELTRVAFPAGRGLDLGCGDGRLTRVITEEVGPLDLVGLDVDPLETALAQRQGLYHHVHTSPADRVPEADASFDFVVSVSVMEHIPRLEPVLHEVARVLKAGGRLITTVPGIGFHDSLRGPLRPGASRADYLQELDRRVAHLRYWSIAEWRTALGAAGMQLVEARPILSRSEMRRWETISRFTAGVLRAMTGGKKAPIEIQRSLGLRRSGQRLPLPLSAMLARLLSIGLSADRPVDERESGCVLIVAVRP